MSHAEILSVDRLPTFLPTVARCRNIQGDVPGALSLLLPYVTLVEEATLPNIRFWKTLGTTYGDLGKADEAIAAFEKGISQAITLNKEVKAAEITISQARCVLSLTQNPDRASALALQAMTLLHRHEAKEARVHLAALHGAILMTKRNPEEAKVLLTQALYGTRPLLMKDAFVSICGDMASLYMQTGDLPESIALLETILETHCPEYKYTIPFFLVKLSHAYRLKGEPHKAIECSQRALDIGTQLGWNYVTEQANQARQLATDPELHLLMLPAPLGVYSHLALTQSQSLPSGQSCARHD